MSACIPWWGYVNVLGYGMRSVSESGRALAHRLIFEECFGPIPDGYHVHHKCHVRHCVNPEHLQLILAGEHTRLHHPRPTHCKKGHPFDEANKYVHPRTGWWTCRRCRADGMRAANRARRLRESAA